MRYQPTDRPTNRPTDTPKNIEQGRIHGRKVVAGGWAGAVRSRSGAAMLLGPSSNAQKSPFQLILPHPKFRVTDRQTDRHTFLRAQPLIESLSQ